VAYENLTRATGCYSQKDQLACLRGIDEQTLVSARQSLTWNPMIDGTFLTGYPSQLILGRKFNAVPMIIGANTDEGFAIGNPNSEEELFQEMFRWRNYALSPPTMRKLLDLYPNDPCSQPPHHVTNCSLHPTRGSQWRRAFAIGGDIAMISGRRKLAELWAEVGETAYSYRFDQLLWSAIPWDGVKHFDNVAFSFQNISGLLGPSPAYDSHVKLARDIGESYVRFVNTLNPNVLKGKTESKFPVWPKYDRKSPKNLVMNATNSWVEEDTWRKKAIAFINSYAVSRELYS
jgi:carboxylesterase type B